MQFLYFVPSVTREDLKPETLHTVGLDGVFRDRMTTNDVAGLGGLAVARVVRGPGGQEGVILQVSDKSEDAPAQVGYFPELHTWVDCGRYWIGYDPQQLPTPEQLERDEVIRGSDVTLADGRVWEAPIIRARHNEHRLPDTWKVVDGKIVHAIRKEWSWAWELSGQVWNWHVSSTVISKEQAFDWSVRLLSINYRIGIHEAGILGIIGAKEYQSILHAAVAGPMIDEYHELQKKS